MQSSLKIVKQLTVVVLVALVAVMGSQMVAKYAYQAEVKPGVIMADDPAPCPAC